MLQRAIILLFLGTSISLYAGGNSSMSKKMGAFEFEGAYVADNIMNLHGGIQSGYGYLGFATLTASYNFETAGLWKGGKLNVMGASTHGAEPTANMIGDFQTVSNIEAGDLIYVQELWYSQQLNHFCIIAGVQDMNVEFLASDYGSNFINSSFGIISTVADNVPSPIFPLTGLGVTLGYRLSDHFELKSALYDGDLLDFEFNQHNTQWDYNLKDGYLAIAEMSLQPSLLNGLQGNFKLGGYWHKHTEHTEESMIATKNSGIYTIIDQQVYTNEAKGEEIGLFIQAGLSPQKYNNNYAYWGAGVLAKGVFNKRPDDTMGLATATAFFKEHIYPHETAIECTYSAQITPAIRLQPDFQYVIHPAGTDEKLPNASIVNLRIEISF